MTVAPEFVVRVANMPATVLNELRCEGTYACIVELLATREWLATEADEIGGQLYRLIPAVEPRSKPRVVGLRRVLHQCRSVGGVLETVTADLPSDLVTRIRDWEAQRARQSRRFGELSELLAAELPQRVESLRRLAGHPDLQRGLVSTCPDLYVKLRPWLLDHAHRQPKRHSLLSLSRYVARMAAKTSPRSSFTLVGLGRWVAEGPAYRITPAWDRCVVVEPHAGLVQALKGRLAHHPRLLEQATIRSNPSAVVDDDRVWWVSPAPDSPLLSARMSTPLRACLQAAAPPQGCDLATLRRAALAAAGAKINVTAVEHFIGELLRTCLLQPQLPIPDQCEDPLGQLSACLAAAEAKTAQADDLRAIRSGLVQVRTELRRFAGAATPDERLSHRTVTESALREVAERAGVLPAHVPLPDGTAFFDSTAVLGTMAELNSTCWTPKLQSLDILRRALALFDPKVLFRLGLARYFVTTFGRGARVPYLDVFRAFFKDGQAPGVAHELQRLRLLLSPEEEHAALAHLPTDIDDRLGTVVALRRSLVGDIARQPAGPNNVIEVPQQLLLRYITRWPHYLAPPGSIAAYVQVAPYANDPIHLVLNGIDSGYGRGRARVRRMVTGGRGGQVAQCAKPPAETTLVAELDAVFGNTVNLRQVSVPYTIDYPGCVPDRQPSRVLALGELLVTHQPDNDLLQLVAPSRGKRVKLVYTGTMWELLLPPAVRLLMDAFAEPAMFIPPHSWWLNGEVRSLPRGVEFLPRIDMGGLTLRRACWATCAHQVPRRNAGEGDALYLLRLVAWLRTEGIPDRTFVRVLRAADGRAARLLRHRKPMLFDVANWFLVMAFEQSLGRDDDLVFFTEELPPVGSAPCAERGEARVTEFVIEVSELAGWYG